MGSWVVDADRCAAERQRGTRLDLDFGICLDRDRLARDRYLSGRSFQRNVTGLAGDLNALPGTVDHDLPRAVLVDDHDLLRAVGVVEHEPVPGARLDQPEVVLPGLSVVGRWLVGAAPDGAEHVGPPWVALLVSDEDLVADLGPHEQAA